MKTQGPFLDAEPEKIKERKEEQEKLEKKYGTAKEVEDYLRSEGLDMELPQISSSKASSKQKPKSSPTLEEGPIPASQQRKSAEATPLCSASEHATKLPLTYIDNGPLLISARSMLEADRVLSDPKATGGPKRARGGPRPTRR